MGVWPDSWPIRWRKSLFYNFLVLTLLKGRTRNRISDCSISKWWTFFFNPKYYIRGLQLEEESTKGHNKLITLPIRVSLGEFAQAGRPARCWIESPFWILRQTDRKKRLNPRRGKAPRLFKTSIRRSRTMWMGLAFTVSGRSRGCVCV